MTSYTPSPHGPNDSSTRVRVKWDNVMIVLIGTVVAAFAVVGILMYSGPSPKQAPEQDTTAETASEVEEFTAATQDAPAGELSLDDAIGVVEEVRSLMSEGRWDEAADRLELIPEQLRDASGATIAQQELTDQRASHDQLRAQLEAAVEAQNWKGAQTLLGQLSALAPLDADLTATQELVDTALAPKQPVPAADAPDAKGTKASKDSATSGGGAGETKPATSPTTKPAATTRPAAGTKPASGTKPAASTPKPSTGGTRPAATGGGASTGGGAAGSAGAASTGAGGSSSNTSPGAGIGSGSSLADLGINLTPQQEAELEAALDQAMAGL